MWCQCSQLHQWHKSPATLTSSSGLFVIPGRLCNGAGCFTTVKNVGRIYSQQLVVAALLLISQRVHIKPLSPSGPTNRISFPTLVSNNLHGAPGSSGSLCWYPTPRTSWTASAPTSSTCTTANLSTTQWVNRTPCNQQKQGLFSGHSWCSMLSFQGNYDQYVKTRLELEENQMKRFHWEQDQIAHMKVPA